MALARLKELENEMHKCFRCNLCKMIPLPVVRNPDFFDSCPATMEYGFHSYSGSGKQIMALSLVQGRITADEKLLEISNACTTCGSCDVSCKFVMDAERQQVNMALREHIVEQGIELEAHKSVINNLTKHGHPDGKPKHPPGEFAKDLNLKHLPDEKADVLLFAGCLQCNDPYSSDVVKKFAKLLIHAGVDVGILGDSEPTCGLPAFQTGYRDVFSSIAENTTNTLDKLGVSTIVTVSGSCLGSFRSKYPEYAQAPSATVLHATEYLWKLINDNKLKLPKPVNKKVTYHDPCYLGRQSEPPVEWKGETKLTRGVMVYDDPPKPVNRGCNGVFDAPRNILKAIKGLNFEEMYRIREYSLCCGGGGGVPKAYPELAQSTAIHRMEEARDVGAEHLVTACHQCRINLMNADKSQAPNHMPILDIIDLVYEAADLT